MRVMIHIAQEELTKRDNLIESLTAAGAEYQRQCFEQSDRIKWLEQQIARLKTVPMKYRRMEFNAQLQRENTEQAAEITRLKVVIGECKEVLEDCHQNINQERGYASEIERDIEQTLAAIKEEGL